MTFKELQKAIHSDTNGQSYSIDLSKLQNKPFWIFDKEQHKLEDIRTKGQCCFWHFNPPKKDGHPMPVLPYQKILYDALQNHKHIWIKKSRGIGCSEFLLRYIAWICINKIQTINSRVCIITGPRIDLAEDLIARFKGLFSEIAVCAISDRTQSTVAYLNGVKVEAFPSHHVDTMRGLTDVKFILSDESDMYPIFQQREVRAVMEGYIGKPNSNPTIVLVSTPKAPGGLMQQIELEEDSLYHKLFFDYHYGLEGPYPIYSEDQIAKARLSPEFGREYEGLYLGIVGNCFSTASIELSQKHEYNPEVWRQNVITVAGVDAGFGSSATGIVVTQLYDQRIHVVYAEEFERPEFSSIIDRIWELNKRAKFTNIMTDAANPEIASALKREFGESADWNFVHDKIAWCKKYNLYVEDSMRIVPVPFSTEGKKMLQHTKYLVEDPEGLIAIHPKFQKLLISLRTATATEFKLDKTLTSHNDCLDSFMLSLQFYRRAN